MRKLLELQANQIELDTGYWVLADRRWREGGDRAISGR